MFENNNGSKQGVLIKLGISGLLLMGLQNAAFAAGPKDGLDVTIVNTGANAVPVVVDGGSNPVPVVLDSGSSPVPVMLDAASGPVPVVSQDTVSTEPVFLRFGMALSDNWRSTDYTVPSGKRLRISLVSARTSGVSSATSDINTNLVLRIRYDDGAGATCNSPTSSLACVIDVSVMQLNNSDTGANMGTYYGSVSKAVSMELPPGATLSTELGPFGPGDSGLSVSAVIAGILVDAE
jgi:hypothetical protein